MRSHFKTRSPPAELARCDPLFHILNVLVPTGFVLVGQKIVITRRYVQSVDMQIGAD